MLHRVGVFAYGLHGLHLAQVDDNGRQQVGGKPIFPQCHYHQAFDVFPHARLPRCGKVEKPKIFLGQMQPVMRIYHPRAEGRKAHVRIGQALQKKQWMGLGKADQDKLPVLFKGG